MLAYYTRRENIHFAVVNRAWTASKTPVTLLIIHFFCTIGLINVIVLIAVVLTSPGMPEPRVQWVQVHPMPFVFITFWVQCGCRLWVQRVQTMGATGAQKT
jgi:DMSO/TMAO reductase YedYZ heme-binding membrane subunit